MDSEEGGGGGKSERKRKRERQRRSDLATAFEELATLVAQIDPAEEEPSNKGGASRSRSGRGKAAEEPPDVDSMTRLDLIGRTTAVLRRLQRENADLRRRIDEKGRADDTEVLVMVPTLNPVPPPQPDIDRRPHYGNPPGAPPNYYMPPPPHPMMMMEHPSSSVSYGGGYYHSGSYAPPAPPASYGGGSWDSGGGGYPLPSPPSSYNHSGGGEPRYAPPPPPPEEKEHGG